MSIRFAATMVLVFGAGGVAAILAGSETMARSGGVHAAGPALASPAAGRGGLRPFLHSGRAAVGRHPGLRSDSLRASILRHRRFGFGWPAEWGGWPWYDSSYYQPYYDPLGHSVPDDAASLPYPTPGYPTPPYLGAHSSTVAQPIVYVIPYRPGCDQQTQMLPWRDGAERSVTIVRC